MASYSPLPPLAGPTPLPGTNGLNADLMSENRAYSYKVFSRNLVAP